MGARAPYVVVPCRKLKGRPISLFCWKPFFCKGSICPCNLCFEWLAILDARRIRLYVLSESGNSFQKILRYGVWILRIFFFQIAGWPFLMSGVSKNRGTPKSMVYSGNHIKMDDLGVPLFSETSIWKISILLVYPTIIWDFNPSLSASYRGDGVPMISAPLMVQKSGKPVKYGTYLIIYNGFGISEPSTVRILISWLLTKKNI